MACQHGGTGETIKAVVRIAIYRALAARAVGVHACPCRSGTCAITAFQGGRNTAPFVGPVTRRVKPPVSYVEVPLPVRGSVIETP